MYGNLHILPKPTAEPTVVTINAYFDVQDGLLFSKISPAYKYNFIVVIFKFYHEKFLKHDLPENGYIFIIKFLFKIVKFY